MEPKLIKGLQADYIAAEYPGRNTSGLRAWGKNVVVLVDECSPSSKGGIMLMDDMIERMTAASTTGVLIACAPEAFRLFDDGSRWTGDHPQPGDRLWFEKYAGQLQTGVDGRTYRIMDYRAIAATVDTEGLALTEAAGVVAAVPLHELDIAASLKGTGIGPM